MAAAQRRSKLRLMLVVAHCVKSLSVSRRRPVLGAPGRERPFQPRHPLARYCAPTCQAAARRWSRSRAAARYRATERGRACRRQQVCRYRQRARERREAAAEAQAETNCEGHQEAEDSEKVRCHRPGCYERSRSALVLPVSDSAARCAVRRCLACGSASGVGSCVGRGGGAGSVSCGAGAPPTLPAGCQRAASARPLTSHHPGSLTPNP
jgi:hypothetical protein